MEILPVIALTLDYRGFYRTPMLAYCQLTQPACRSICIHLPWNTRIYFLYWSAMLLYLWLEFVELSYKTCLSDSISWWCWNVSHCETEPGWWLVQSAASTAPVRFVWNSKAKWPPGCCESVIHSTYPFRNKYHPSLWLLLLCTCECYGVCLTQSCLVSIFERERFAEWEIQSRSSADFGILHETYWCCRGGTLD